MDRQGPSISSDMILDVLLRDGVVDEQRLVQMLGADRHSGRIDTVEIALVRNDVISVPRLLALKSALSGMAVLEEGSFGILPILEQSVARSTGALVVDRPVPTVAFVEDLPMNLEKVAQTLGRRDFEVWLMTAPQFAELYRTIYQGGQTGRKQETRDIFEIFDEAITKEASDIHLSVNLPPMLRLDGSLVPMDRTPLSDEWIRNQVRNILGEPILEEVLRKHNRDAGYSYGPVRFRINVGADMHGLTMAIRRLPNRIPDFDTLGLPISVRRFADLERGLVLVTGPTGSGKSTTLATLLSHIAINQSRHILTLEDPIEFVLPAKKSIVHQREHGISFTSFADGLRQSLRQDPDVILVGEARDQETIRAAVTAAETGALVFATLHTYDAASSLGRIISSYPEGEQDQIRSQLAYVLKGVVSQSLVPAISGGRIAAFEVLLSTPGVMNNLRKVDGLLQIRQLISTGIKQGMQTMEMHLAQLVRRGLISEAEAEFKARDMDEFRRHLTTGPEIGGV